MPRKITFIVFLTFLFCRSALAQEKPYFYKNVKVLSIGIDDYADSRIKTLTNAKKDAEEVARVLRQQFGFQTQLLLNANASKKSIQRALAACNDELGVDDVLIIYLACHGRYFEYADDAASASKSAGFFVAHDSRISLDDTNVERWRSEAIDMQVLVDSLVKFKCQHVVLIADTCCSGFLTKRGSIEHQGLTTLLVEGSRSVMAATKKSESAKDGLFTTIMVDRLGKYSKKKEAFTLTDLFVEIRPDVTNKSENQMTPMISKFGEMDGEFVFFPRSIPQSKIDLLERSVKATVSKGGNVNGELELIRGIRDRVEQRIATKMRLEELIEAFSALNYRYSSRPESGRSYWKNKFEKFHEHAGLGNPLAMAALHYCYSKGLGTEKDPDNAYFWARLAYETGHPAGKHVLGRSYMLGVGVIENDEAGLVFIESAATGLDAFPISQVTWGLELLLDKKYAQAKALFNEASNFKIPYATYRLAMFSSGEIENFEKNLKELEDVLNRASEQGSPDALHELALLFSGKHGHQIDNSKALLYLEKAASLGSRFSQGQLAEAYYFGSKVKSKIPYDMPVRVITEQNLAAARRWAELGIKHDDQLSHLILFYIFSDSDRVEFNETKAMEHLRTVAESGSLVGGLELAKAYYDGDIVQQNLDEAFRLFRRMGNFEQAESCIYLGLILESRLLSKPVSTQRRDRKDAVEWYLKGLRYGLRDVGLKKQAEARLRVLAPYELHRQMARIQLRKLVSRASNAASKTRGYTLQQISVFSAVKKNSLAWDVVTDVKAGRKVSSKDLLVAKIASLESVFEQPANYAYLDTLSHLFFIVDNDLNMAIETQKRAVSYAPDADSIAECKSFLNQLVEIQATSSKR